MMCIAFVFVPLTRPSDPFSYSPSYSPIQNLGFIEITLSKHPLKTFRYELDSLPFYLDGGLGVCVFADNLSISEMDDIKPAPSFGLPFISLFTGWLVETPLVEDFLLGLIDKEILPSESKASVIFKPGFPRLV